MQISTAGPDQGCVGERKVASEAQLIEAREQGCERISCLNGTRLTAHFFQTLTGPLQHNMTLSGSVFLDWVDSTSSLMQLQAWWDNSTGPLLPIAYGNSFKMADLHLQGSSTSVNLFMEMLAIPSPGPGQLVLENTSWTVLDCPQPISFLNYITFLPAVRPDVYASSGNYLLIPDVLVWRPKRRQMTVPDIRAVPLEPAQFAAGNWTAVNTVSMINFTTGCAPGFDRARAAEPPSAPACVSRTVRTEAELSQAREDGCRHIQAQPRTDATGGLVAPLLSINYHQWRQDFAVNTTLSGVVNMSFPTNNSMYMSVPVVPGAWFALWNLDVITTYDDVLLNYSRLRVAGPGGYNHYNVRFIMTDCTAEDLEPIRNLVIIGQAIARVSEYNVTLDYERSALIIDQVAEYGSFSRSLTGFFGQDYRSEWINTSLLCVPGWDVQKSVDYRSQDADATPPSLLGVAAGAAASDAAFIGSQGAEELASQQDSSSDSLGSAAIVGICLAAAAVLAVALAVVLAWKMRVRGKKSAAENPPASHEHSGEAGSSEALPRLEPEESSSLLERPACADMLQDYYAEEGSRVLASLQLARPRADGGVCACQGNAEQLSALPAGAAGAQAYAASMASAQEMLMRVMPPLPGIDLDVDLDQDVQLGRVLGEGTDSIVLEGVWRPGTEREQLVAVKVVDTDGLGSDKELEQYRTAFRRELNLLSRINHPCIVRCFGGSLRGNSVCILLENMPAGTLSSYIHQVRRNSRLELQEILAVVIQVASALAHLHPVIVHADLKPDNCLLSTDGRVKLADFGTSKVKWRTAVPTSGMFGTPQYAAPEVFKEGLLSEKCDVYSLGMLIWECLTGEQPWADVNNPVQLYHMVKVQGRRPPIPESCDPQLASMICRCWQQDPSMRPSAAELARKAQLLDAAVSDAGGIVARE